jgi:tetratricopeptide (TPR) repeat protein
MYQKAIALDPKYADAYAGLGYLYWLDWVWQFDPDPHHHALDRALELAQRAIALDDSNAFAYEILASIDYDKGLNDKAIGEAEHAVALNPNAAISYFKLAEVLAFSGKFAESREATDKAMRLDPLNPNFYLANVGFAFILQGRYAEAIPVFKKSSPAILIILPSAFRWPLPISRSARKPRRAKRPQKSCGLIRGSSEESMQRGRSIIKDQALRERFRTDLTKAGLK